MCVSMWSTTYHGLLYIRLCYVLLCDVVFSNDKNVEDEKKNVEILLRFYNIYFVYTYMPECNSDRRVTRRIIEMVCVCVCEGGGLLKKNFFIFWEIRKEVCYTYIGKEKLMRVLFGKMIYCYQLKGHTHITHQIHTNLQEGNIVDEKKYM